MTINQELFDRQVAHSISLRRYSETTGQVISELSNNHRSRLRELLRGNLRAPIGPEVSRYINELHGRTSGDLSDFFGAETDFQANSLNRAVGDFYSVQRPNRTEILRQFTRSPLRLSSNDNTFQQEFALIGNSETTRINARIRRGLVQGRSQTDIINDVLRTTRLTEAQARTLVNTTYTQAESHIRKSVASSNANLYNGSVFSAILDGRTSRICSSLDNKFQLLGEELYTPPIHWNCRSVLVYMLKSQDALLETARTDTRFDLDRLASVTPGDLNGELPATETFTTWLTRQAMTTKLRYLDSEERVSLFERGRLKIGDFLSFRGNPISLAALRLRDNAMNFDRTDLTEPRINSSVSRPFQLTRSRALQNELREFYIANSVNPSSPLQLVDYKGTTLAGKRSVRRRTNNEFDPRNQSVNSETGAVINSLYYDPDFTVYRERVDFMRDSKLLDQKQKDFIESFSDSLEDRVSVNQRTAIVENLRIVFERYERSREPWDSLAAILNRELSFSVVNTSRILDRRSRTRASLFNGWTGDVDQPSIMIMGERVTLKQLSDRKNYNEAFVRDWPDLEGRKFARQLLVNFQGPLRFLFNRKSKKATELVDKLVAAFRLKRVRSRYYRDNPANFYLRYGKIDSYKDIIKKHIAGKVTGSIPFYKFITKLSREGLIEFVKRTVRERYRRIVDYEFYLDQRLKRARESVIRGALSAGKGRGRIEDLSGILANITKTIAEGVTTDYDALAIQVGQSLIKKWPGFDFLPSTLQSFHREGSQILDFFRDQGYIRVNSRGVTRRAVTDMDTLRPGGAWKDTVSREIQVVDPTMLQLQRASAELRMANRIGVTDEGNRYYIVPGKKTYQTATGEDTGIPMITRSAFATFDAKSIDRDFAAMLNWQMNRQYSVDDTFATFMNGLVRFKDQRGKAEYYDRLNVFRDEIVRRGDQGYGLMETLRYHQLRGKPFRTIARIDSRGRIYYNGG